MKQRHTLTIPLEVVEKSLGELGTGVRVTIDSSVKLWRARKMMAGELESLLQSVAWQSPTLKSYFEGISRTRKRSEETFDVLSDDDIMALLEGDVPAAKKARTEERREDQAKMPAEREKEENFEVLLYDDVIALIGLSGTTLSTSAEEEAAARKVESDEGMKKVLSTNNFDYLAISDCDHLLDADYHLSDIAFTPHSGSNLPRNLSSSSYIAFRHVNKLDAEDAPAPVLKHLSSTQNP